MTTSMKNLRIFLAVLAIAAFASTGAFAGHSEARKCRNDTGKSTRAGSTKDNNCQLSCGSNGAVYSDQNGSVTANPNTNNPSGGKSEVEVCRSTGTNDASQGRIVVQVDPNEGARLILDSDHDQAAGATAGFMTVQAGLPGNDTGIYCTAVPDEPNQRRAQDGYEQGWTYSGSGYQSNADCVVNFTKQ